MKKYEVKGWCIWFGFLFTLLIMVSCRTAEKTRSQIKDKTEVSIFDDINLDNKVESSVSSSELELQRQMFSDFLSSLNIGYNGQTESDKLLFEMKRTIDGLNFQVSGTGTANYQQRESINIDELKNELFKQQDSLFKQALNGFLKQNKQYLNEHLSKEKEVKTTGFSFGMYVIIGLAVLLGILLNWLGRKLNFKIPLKGFK